MTKIKVGEFQINCDENQLQTVVKGPLQHKVVKARQTSTEWKTQTYSEGIIVLVKRVLGLVLKEDTLHESVKGWLVSHNRKVASLFCFALKLHTKAVRHVSHKKGTGKGRTDFEKSTQPPRLKMWKDEIIYLEEKLEFC